MTVSLIETPNANGPSLSFDGTTATGYAVIRAIVRDDGLPQCSTPVDSPFTLERRDCHGLLYAPTAPLEDFALSFDEDHRAAGELVVTDWIPTLFNGSHNAQKSHQVFCPGIDLPVSKQVLWFGACHGGADVMYPPPGFTWIAGTYRKAAGMWLGVAKDTLPAGPTGPLIGTVQDDSTSIAQVVG